MNRILVVGLGSIGRRHLQVAHRCFPDAELLALSSSGRSEIHALDLPLVHCLDLSQAIARDPQLAIVASPANFHLGHAGPLLKAGIPTLLEKPLCADTAEAVEFIRHCPKVGRVGVAYLLRFSPLIQRLRQLLSEKFLGDLLHVQLFTGQYLPQWRPNSDYRNTVSAQRALGGGVLLELSHELDLLTWLLGPVGAICASVQLSKSLQIDTEDCADMLLRMNSGLVVNLHLDMLQHQPRREWLLVGTQGSLKLDMIGQRLEWRLIDESEPQVAQFQLSADQLFEEQLNTFVGNLDQQHPWPGASLDDGLAVLKLIDGIRESEQQQRWVTIDGS